MGWKGAMRSIDAASRAASREADRAYKQQMKRQIAADAANDVMAWQEQLSDLVSLHKNLIQPFDWTAISHSQPPQLPVRLQTRQQTAQSSLNSFKPKLLDKLWGGSQKRLVKLKSALSSAIDDDHKAHQLVCAEYEKKLAEYEADISISRRLAAGETDAIKEVISEMQTLSDAKYLCSSISFQINSNFLHVKPNLFDTSIVPNFRRKQLASGKLSETKMPVGEFNELYQDYVASAAFRIAGDMFNILLLDEVYVTCFAEMLDTSTGHLDYTPILSVQFVRSTFKRLNLDAIDPSDALQNFNHVINFKRTKGFLKITPLQSLE